MKITYLHNTDINTSTANLTQVISMCNGFCNKSIDITLYLPINKNNSVDKTLDTIKNNFVINDKLEIKFFNNISSNYKVNKNINFISIISILKKDNSDYYFIRDVRYLLVAVLLKKQVIFESHNFLIHNGSHIINYFLSTLLILLSKSKRFKTFISISKNLRNYWVSKGVPRKKMLVLHDGFDIDVYRNLMLKKDARVKCNIPKLKKIAMYTGNIVPNRGIHYIIELSRKLQDVDFYILGGPEKYISYYQDKFNIKDQKNIFFLGQIPHKEIADYQVASDVLLGIWSKEVPTINYCSPLKIFEYMASGVPTIAFGYPTILEVINHGDNGFISSPDDVEDLRNKVIYVINSPEESSYVGNNAREYALLNYSWDARVDRILNNIG